MYAAIIIVIIVIMITVGKKEGEKRHKAHDLTANVRKQKRNNTRRVSIPGAAQSHSALNLNKLTR